MGLAVLLAVAFVAAASVAIAAAIVGARGEEGETLLSWGHETRSEV